MRAHPTQPGLSALKRIRPTDECVAAARALRCWMNLTLKAPPHDLRRRVDPGCKPFSMSSRAPLGSSATSHHSSSHTSPSSEWTRVRSCCFRSGHAGRRVCVLDAASSSAHDDCRHRCRRTGRSSPISASPATGVMWLVLGLTGAINRVAEACRRGRQHLELNPERIGLEAYEAPWQGAAITRGKKTPTRPASSRLTSRARSASASVSGSAILFDRTAHGTKRTRASETRRSAPAPVCAPPQSGTRR